jgi:hypothetical protein
VSVSFDPIEVDSELIRENAKQPQAELGLKLRGVGERLDAAERWALIPPLRRLLGAS